MPKWLRHLAVLSAVAAMASPAQGWGPRGHRIMTRIAVARLTPKAAAAVRELLVDGDTLVDVCDWADHEGHNAVPNSASWHYVNVPIDAARYDDKYCSSSKGCVVTKIKDFRKVLANRRTPLRERRRALLFLVHFVEDIHQPLHVGDNRDRGGNLTQVQFDGRGTNLHRVWDSDLIHHIGGSDKTWVERISPLITKEHAQQWSSGSVEDWANESLKAAKFAYAWPKKSRTPLAGGTTLRSDYVDHVRPILEERLAQGGLRLANELNEIFK